MYYMLNWLVPAMASAAQIGAYNLFLEASGKHLGKDNYAKMSYVMMILVVSGAFATAALLLIRSRHASSFAKARNLAHRDGWRVLLPALLCISYMVTNIIALSEGGGIAITVIYLNIFINIIGSSLLFGSKLNARMVGALALAVGAISYANYENKLLNG